MQMKSAQLSAARRAKYVIIGKIKCFSQKKQLLFGNSYASQGKGKKLSLTIHLRHRRNVFITHDFSQLRTTLSQGSKKTLRVWQEASRLATDMHLQSYSRLLGLCALGLTTHAAHARS